MISVLFSIILLTFNDFTTNNALECKLSKSTCIFSGIRTNRSSLYFNPSAPENAMIKTIGFKDSVMPIFTDELCKAFPFIRTLFADDLSMEEVAPNALYACKNLLYVSFHSNKLLKLDPNTFDMNYNLENIILQNNSLTSIDGKMFQSVPNLKHLSVADNYLTDLPLKDFPKLERLTDLDIYVNDLRDLDDKELVQKFPNLKNIFMHNNVFDCNRLLIILLTLTEHKIVIKEWEREKSIRNTRLPRIANVECVPSKRDQNGLYQSENPEPEPEPKQKNYTFLIIIGAVCFLSLCALAAKLRECSGSRNRNRTNKNKTYRVAATLHGSDNSL